MATDTTTTTELARAIGRIEGHQEQSNERMRDLTGRMDRLELKVDRLTWLGITVLAGTLATLVVNFIGV